MFNDSYYLVDSCINMRLYEAPITRKGIILVDRDIEHEGSFHECKEVFYSTKSLIREEGLDKDKGICYNRV